MQKNISINGEKMMSETKTNVALEKIRDALEESDMIKTNNSRYHEFWKLTNQTEIEIKEHTHTIEMAVLKNHTDLIHTLQINPDIVERMPITFSERIKDKDETVWNDIKKFIEKWKKDHQVK